MIGAWNAHIIGATFQRGPDRFDPSSPVGAYPVLRRLIGGKKVFNISVPTTGANIVQMNFFVLLRARAVAATRRDGGGSSAGKVALRPAIAARKVGSTRIRREIQEG
jgi:hypothetical protein